MSVLVFAESSNQKFKKSTFEAITYARKAAEALGVEAIALTVGAVGDVDDLAAYGVSRIAQINYDGGFDSQVYATAIAEAARQLDAKLVVLSHTSTGKSLLGRIGVKLAAGTAAGINSLPKGSVGQLSFTKPVFSGKALATVEIATPVAVVSLMGNALPPERVGGTAQTETLSVALPEPKIRVKSVDRVEGITPLPEAELVVSAGRGLKDPENWGIIEQLASELNATTACSRPVADAGWRPHHEHVGQTGIAVRPNLYIAIGISGAIQHLAGVNNSKTIVVINKDPEAPFFKAADYGVVGDLFEVVPKLTEAVKRYNAQH